MENVLPNNHQKRSEYIDALKIIATASVVIYHVCMHYWNIYGMPGWNSIIGYSALTRFCVPIFFMASGALMIGSSVNISTFFKRRFSKILIPLVFWSFFYYIFTLYINSDFGNFSVSDALRQLISQPSSIHLWFLYAILGIYLTIPLWASINSEKKMMAMVYYTALWFLFASLFPFLRLLAIDVPKDLGSWYFVNETVQFYNYSGYFSLGYVLFCLKDSKQVRNISIVAYLVSSIIIFFLVLFDSQEKKMISQDYWDFKAPFVVIMSISIFLIIKSFDGFLAKINKPLSYIANLTFGVYLCHVAFIYLVCNIYSWALESVPMFLRIPIQSTAVLLLSFLATFFISKIKILRKVI